MPKKSRTKINTDMRNLTQCFRQAAKYGAIGLVVAGVLWVPTWFVGAIVSHNKAFDVDVSEAFCKASKNPFSAEVHITNGPRLISMQDGHYYDGQDRNGIYVLDESRFAGRGVRNLPTRDWTQHHNNKRSFKVDLDEGTCTVFRLKASFVIPALFPDMGRPIRYQIVDEKRAREIQEQQSSTAPAPD